MGYLFDHTAFYDPNPLYLIPVIFMFATMIFCIIRVQKMKKELKNLETELSGKLAETAIEEPEPMMRHTLDEETPENN